MLRPHLAEEVTAMLRKPVQPQGWRQVQSLSQGVRFGNLLFVSGQVATDPQGKLVGQSDFEAQAIQVMENIKAILEAAGSHLDNVLKITTFITRLEDRAKMYEIRNRYFTEPRPASTAVVVKSLVNPDYLIEMECVAALE
ncbi:MAG: RidA family protein [Chloroflexi bacterium]|nr:RidA family protein [Chloroflexota bacterium]